MEDRLRSESLTTAAAGLFELVLQRVEGLDGDVVQTGSADVGHSKPHTQPIDQSPRLLTALTGPYGVTKQASSFSRREAIIDLAARSAIHGTTAEVAAGRIEVLVNRLLRDDRVVPVLEARRTKRGAHSGPWEIRGST
jgi:hypothetical protein